MNLDPKNISQGTKSGLALDIDETLSWTIGYWVEKMQEKFGNPENLTVKEMVEKYRYSNNIPYWQHAEALEWVSHMIWSDEIQKELPLIEEADLYVNKINEIIPIAAYITARPEKVLNGTKEWLKNHGFPEAPIICKPRTVEHNEENNNKWKADVLKQSYPNIIGIIDDNVKLLEFLGDDYKGTVFLYDHVHNQGLSDTVACPNWLSVYKEVKQRYQGIGNS